MSNPQTGPIYDGEPPRSRSYVNQSVRVAKAGASFGSALAIAISWGEHHSIFWAIIQGFFSWLYVIYYALTH
jgi:hypothetical protein